jgi:hypothetical protein
MDLNYAIFRSEPIYTLNDLAQIGSHNKREKKAYNSNPDIRIEDSCKNIELVPLNCKYVKGFKELTKEYEKQHNEKMKTERKERQRSYTQMLNKSKNVVADELLFTATNRFFKDMTTEDIKKWADTCMDFVYEDLGYTKEQILHATVHLDEKTPHIHCVVVPLVKKLDKRTNTERYTISKKQYIKDKFQLSELQDKYHQRLTEKGYDLERGIKGSDNEHVDVKNYKKMTYKLEHDINIRNDRLQSALKVFEEQMKTSKPKLLDKNKITIEKHTFDSMNNVISETKKIMEIQPKLEKVFSEVNNFTNSYKSLEKQNQKYKKEINSLEARCDNLERENRSLKYRLEYLFESIKKFFRKLLQRGNEKTKDDTTKIVKDYYDSEEFDMQDVVGISRGTTKQDELFEYVEAPDYLKSRVKDYDEYEKDKDDFEIGF